MRLYLSSFDLFAHVDGSAEPPKETASAQVNKAFETAARRHGRTFVWPWSLRSKYTSETRKTSLGWPEKPVRT